MIEPISPQDKLIWLDMEMTGLDPEHDRILEVAVIATDAELAIVEQGPVLAVHQSDAVLAAMDAWNQEHHTASGLVKRVRQSDADEAAAEEQLLAFVRRHAAERTSPLCGNSIWQDRRFVAKYLPRFDRFLHYRNIDVSSVKELARRWYPALPEFPKKKSHTALEDIKESIAELAYYRAHIFIADE